MGKSEFGRGLVVCLVKFSEHFHNPMARQIYSINSYLSKNPEERKLMTSPNPPSNLDYGKEIHDQIKFFTKSSIEIWGTEEKAFSHDIEVWANGATDHLYEIMVPKRWKGTEIETNVNELQELGLKMGHGFTGIIWTFKDFLKLQELTKKIVVLIDQNIGLKRQVDWGEW